MFKIVFIRITNLYDLVSLSIASKLFNCPIILPRSSLLSQWVRWLPSPPACSWAAAAPRRCYTPSPSWPGRSPHSMLSGPAARTAASVPSLSTLRLFGRCKDRWFVLSTAPTFSFLCWSGLRKSPGLCCSMSTLSILVECMITNKKYQIFRN